MLALISNKAVNMVKSKVVLHSAAVIALIFAISWLKIRPYGMLFLILFVLWIFKTRCAACIEITAPPDLHAYVLRIYTKLIKLREDRPAVFCAILSGVLGLLALIGHLVSGSNVVLVGLIVAALVSTKYNFKVVKVPNKTNYSWTEVGDHDVDEFLPEVNESNLFVLQRASDQAIVSSQIGEEDERNEEVPPELLIPDPIPEIDENSDTSSEDDLLLKPFIETPQTMEFKKGYFKKDSSISTSSSSDDESLSKGLNFQDYSVLDSRNNSHTQQEQTTIVSSHISPLNLVSGFVAWSKSNEPKAKAIPLSKKETPTSSQVHDSSEESDFELLDTDDLDNP